MPLRPRYPSALIGLLVLYLLLAVIYVWKTPPGEGVDEIPHFEYVLFVRTQHRLPANLEGQPPKAWMAHHPPLYYTLAAGLLAPLSVQERWSLSRPNPHFRWDEGGRRGWNVWLPMSGRLSDPSERATLAAFYTVRGLSVLLGAVTIWLVYHAIAQVIPGKHWAALGGSALVALNPSFIYMAATIHHDVLLAAVYTAGLNWSLRSLRAPLSRGWLLAGALLAAAALLTKVTGATLAIVMAVAVMIRPVHPQDWPTLPQAFARRVGSLMVMAAAGLVLAGWWLVRNWLLYDDILAWSMFARVHAHMLRPDPFSWHLLYLEVLPQFGRTFWGAFGYMHILLPEWLRLTAWGLTGIALIGGIVGAVRASAVGSISRTRLSAWALLLIAAAVLSLALLRFAMVTGGAGHGRYLFPMAASIGALLIASLNGYTAWRHARAITVALIAILAIYALWAPARYVWPKYQIPPTVSAGELAEAQLRNIVFDGGVTLQAVRLSHQIAVPGQGLDVTTYWSAPPATSPTADPWVELSLVADGTQIGHHGFWPEVATIPAVWNGRTIAYRYPFYIPPNAPPGALELLVQVRNGIDGPLLTTDGQASVVIADLLALGSVIEMSQAQAPPQEREEHFAGSLRLLSAPFPSQIVPGGILPVQLYWEVAAPIEADYTVFIHVLDEVGQIVAQLDRPSGGGTFPTSTWTVGNVYFDTYPVPLPEHLPTGDYRIRLGMYVWPDVTPLPVELGNGNVDSTVILGTVRAH